MITDLEVRGYRSFEHAHAPLGLVTLVTGDTGSGKTGLLDALGFLATCALGGLAAAVEERGGFAAVAHRGARGPVRRAGITVRYRPRRDSSSPRSRPSETSCRSPTWATSRR